MIETKSDSKTNVFGCVPIARVGPTQLATIANQNGHQATVHFGQRGPLDMKDILSAHLVGISTLTMTARGSYRIADICRKAGIKVVAGGIHATFLIEEALSHADFVLRYEAEDSFIELLEALEGKRDFSRIKGLSFWQGGKIIHNPGRPFEENLDKYPFPDWGLMAGGHRYPVVPISTSRGCPFKCTFCTVYKYNGNKYRMRSSENVLAEIDFQRCHNPGMRYLFFTDDNFNANKKRAKEILRGMIENGLHKGIRWGAQMTWHVANDPELMELIYRSNCDRLFIGFESLNPETLKLYGKRERVEDIIRAVRTLHQSTLERGEIDIHGMFIGGSDADTIKDIEEISRFVRAEGFASFQLMVNTPNPGSEDWKQFQNGRVLLSRHWPDFDGHHVVHIPKKITPYDLQVGIIKATREFYSFELVAKTFFKEAREILKGAREVFSERGLTEAIKETQKSLFGYGLKNTAVRFTGWKGLRNWTKNPHNKAHVRLLKKLSDKIKESPS